MSSATAAIFDIVGRQPRGTATPGTRRRAILATCTDRSPIRSSSLTMRSAATTVRRSPATGCWSDSSSKAASSTRSRARSISMSALITCSAMTTSPDMRDSVARRDGHLDLAADVAEVVEDALELVMELIAHAAERRRRHRRARADPVNAG